MCLLPLVGWIMPLYRVQWFMQLGPYGWSEHLHSTKQSLAEVATEAETLTPFRLKMLPRQARITYIRISDDLTFRDSSLIDENAAGQGLASSQPILNSTAVETCALLRITAGTRLRRSMFLRPVPDAVGDNGVRTITNSAFLAAFGVWRAYVQDPARGWAIKGLDPTLPDLQIVAISAPGAPRVFTTVGAHGLSVGMIVRFRGPWDFGFSLSGVFKVATAPTNFSFTVEEAAPIPGTYLGGGFVRRVSRSVFQIQSAFILRVSFRDTGRPFDSPRGRQAKSG